MTNLAAAKSIRPETGGGWHVLSDIAGQIRCDASAPCIDFDGVVLDRGSFAAAVGARQRQLRERGVKRGDFVLIAIGRGAPSWIDMAAVWAAGAVAVPADKDADAVTLEAMVRIAEPALAVGTAWRDPAVLGGLEILPDPEPPHSFAADIELPSGHARDLSTILFTSGSTGLPKGVALSHASCLGNARASAATIGIANDDRVFVSIPARFVSALNHFLCTLGSGAALVGTEQPLVGKALVAGIRQKRATAFGGSPLQARWIAEAAAAAPLPLRWIMSSGDHLGMATIRELRATMPETRIVTAYGLTEVGGRFCLLPDTQLERGAGSVGWPIPGMGVSIRDAEDQPVAPGEEGEVWAEAGDFLMDGYHRNEEATRRVVRGRRFKTGDIGRLDGEGRLWLVGRADDVFKCAGQKVAIPAIEEAIRSLAAFEDFAIVAQPHARLGHVPVVLYVPTVGKTLEKSAVMRELRNRLPSNHLPQKFIETARIPRTRSGKVDRSAVRALAQSLTASP